MHFHNKPNAFVTNVHLKVSDLEKSITYYTQIIGFQVLNKDGNTAYLTTDGTTTLLTLTQPASPSAPSRRKTGLFHFALLLPKRSDLAHIIQHFHSNGIHFGSADHLVSEALYLQDPDGNGIEIYSDRPEEQWSWDKEYVKMDTLPLNIASILNDSTGTWHGLPAETVMGHIHLSVSNLQDVAHFYTKGLGYDIVTIYGTQALFISTGKYHHHIGLNTWYTLNAPKLEAHEVGLLNYSLQLDNAAQAEQIKAQLRAIGAPVIELEQGNFQTEDPSGNVIVLKL